MRKRIKNKHVEAEADGCCCLVVLLICVVVVFLAVIGFFALIGGEK
jgi:hypothetical protein